MARRLIIGFLPPVDDIAVGELVVGASRHPAAVLMMPVSPACATGTVSPLPPFARRFDDRIARNGIAR
jgi:hypothetical protein